MKLQMTILPALMLATAGFIQAQDTTSRPRQSTAPAPTVKTAAPPASRSSDSSPVINKIAVSDPGMPAEKPANTSNKRSSSGKSSDKKKKSSTGVTPK